MRQGATLGRVPSNDALSVLVVGGITVFRYLYDHSTNSLKVLYLFPGTLVRSVQAYDTRVD